MGCFALRVESAAQDVNELLALHKVHTGVRGDVKQRLRRLIEDAYEEMEALECGQEACSYQVCHAIVSDVVEQTLKVALPTADLVREQQHSAALQQEVMELKERLAGSTTRCADLESVLHDLKRAHDYVLHSYFEEVRVLRFKLHDLRHRYQALKEQPTNGHPMNSFRAASFRRPGGPGTTTQSFLIANNNTNNSSSNAQQRAAGMTTLSEFLTSHEAGGAMSAGNTLSPTVEADLCVSFTTPSSTPRCDSSLPGATGQTSSSEPNDTAVEKEPVTANATTEEESKAYTANSQENDEHNSNYAEDEGTNPLNTHRSTPNAETEDEDTSEQRLLAAFDSTQSPRMRTTPPVEEQQQSNNNNLAKDEEEESDSNGRATSALDKSSHSSAPSTLLSLVHGASSGVFGTTARPTEETSRVQGESNEVPQSATTHGSPTMRDTHAASATVAGQGEEETTTNAAPNASRCHACKPETRRGNAIAVPSSRVVPGTSGTARTMNAVNSHSHQMSGQPTAPSASPLMPHSRPMSTLTTESGKSGAATTTTNTKHRLTKQGSLITLPSMPTQREFSYAGGNISAMMMRMPQSPSQTSGHPLQSNSPARHQSLHTRCMSCTMMAAGRSTSSDATSNLSAYNLATFGYDPKSVDAIFDYERYIALLNGCEEGEDGGKEVWEHRYMRLQRERDEAIARLMKERYTARQAAHVGRRLGDEELGALYAALERGQAQLKRYQWFLHVALEEAKMDLSEELQLIRAAHLAFVEEQRQQQTALKEGLHELQCRANSLIGFFHTFMDHVAHVMRGMTREAGAKTQAELLQRHDAMRAQNSFAEFYHYGQLAAAEEEEENNAAGSKANSDGAKLMMATSAKEAAAFWLHNPVTARAKRLLTSLLQLAGKLRASKATQLTKELNERVQLLRRRSMPSDFARHDSAVSLSRSTRQSLSMVVPENATRSHGLNSAYLTAPVFGVENMTGQTLLQELVRLRLHRAAHAVRRDHCERRLGGLLKHLDTSVATEQSVGGSLRDTGAKSSPSDAYAEDQRRCWMLLSERAATRVEEDTRRINHYLLLLRQHIARYRLRRVHSGFASGGAGALMTDEQRRRNELALLQSPYLYDPDVLSSARGTHNNGEEEEEGDPLTQGTNATNAAQRMQRDYRYSNITSSANGMTGVLYVPFGQDNFDAEGQPVNYVVFDKERISLYPYRTTQSGTTSDATEKKETTVCTRGEAVTPYGAVIQYCQGVQAGLPVGPTLGPVYLFRDADADGFYVGDATGQRLPQPTTTMSNDVGYYAESVNGRMAMPMTQIIVPAPLPPSQPTTTADDENVTTHNNTTNTVGDAISSTNAVQDEPYCFHYRDAMQQREAVRQTRTEPLAPVYLAPLVVPTDTAPSHSGQTANNYEGALYRTRDSALYDPDDGPVPLAASRNALLPVSQSSPPPQYSASYTADTVQQQQQSSQLLLRPNPYLFVPPRVCHPEPESATALRIQGVLPPAPPPPVLQPGRSQLLRTAAVNCSPVLQSTTMTQEHTYSVTAACGAGGTEPNHTSHAHISEAEDDAGLEKSEPRAKEAATTIAPNGAAAPVPCLASPRLTTDQSHVVPPLTCNKTNAVAGTTVGLPLAVDEVRQRQSARQEREVRQRSRERLARRAEWARCRAMPEPTEKEKYLRLRLPGLPGGRATTLLPSPQSTVQLQRKLRPLTLQNMGNANTNVASNNNNNQNTSKTTTTSSGGNDAGLASESEASNVLRCVEEGVTASHSLT